jgi:hypothetical protein
MLRGLPVRDAPAAGARLTPGGEEVDLRPTARLPACAREAARRRSSTSSRRKALASHDAALTNARHAGRARLTIWALIVHEHAVLGPIDIVVLP